ncbi:hypothetical protein [Sphaerisporangium perillae]|uniref:hypothetical protein n=1 Tax=Sphaerisporangium perillae TaxID=2935860 RepID=UPI00200DD00A|nr:hypothetical protein [Sphaerisporangium perillae]
MTVRGYSQRAWERAYRAVLSHAFATVPYYREMWADAGARLEEPVTTEASRLDRLLGRLYPVADPHEPRREPPAWLGEPGELFEALLLTGGYRGDRPLFEVREALLDWDRIAPRKARYHVVLSGRAEVADPALRAASVRAFRAAHEPDLLGDGEQVTELAGHPGRVRVFLRRSPAELTRTPAGGGEPATAVPAAEVLHDAHLGYLGARHRDCGQVHVNWRRVHVHQGPAGPLFTSLRRRPVLAHVSLPGTAHLSAGRCRLHGTPILAAREEAP